MKVSNGVHFTKIWVTIATKWPHVPFYIRPNNLPPEIIESLSTDVFEPRTSTGSFCSSFSTFSCLTNKLPSSHFSIYDLLFSTKSELYRSKRRSFDFRLTSLAQKLLCLSSLISEIQRRDLGLDIVASTMANCNKIYKSVFEKIASEFSRCQNTTKTKLV